MSIPVLLVVVHKLFQLCFNGPIVTFDHSIRLWMQCCGPCLLYTKESTHLRKHTKECNDICTLKFFHQNFNNCNSFLVRKVWWLVRATSFNPTFVLSLYFHPISTLLPPYCTPSTLLPPYFHSTSTLLHTFHSTSTQVWERGSASASNFQMTYPLPLSTQMVEPSRTIDEGVSQHLQTQQ